MKKSFLLLLISIMTVFLIAGCAEETTDNGGSTTPPTPPTVVPIDPKDNTKLIGLLGNYEIVFFYTNGADALSISSDCSKVKYYTGKADEKCVQGTNNVEFKGYGKVELDNPNDPSTINITTKMQMTNSCLQNPASCAIYWGMAKNNQYNYNVFTPIPVTAIANGIINGALSVKGVKGRNLIKNVNTAGSTYKFELLSDGTVRNTMVDKSSGLDANVTVIMKKIDVLPSGYTLDKDVLFPQPEIEGFVNSPAPAE